MKLDNRYYCVSLATGLRLGGYNSGVGPSGEAGGDTERFHA